jgi:hypothetical protein
MIKVRIKKVPQARTGYQVQGALVNDVPAMGGADYNAYIGKAKLKESKYITAVPRDEANLEAEGGETVYGDINGDGMPEHKIIKGPRHHSGGVPLKLPEDTFIFSDTRGMRIKDPEILAMFGKGGVNKSFTPAELAKQYDVQKYRAILEDPETDAIERKTAELMIKKYVVKLGCLALAQESMKGFPQGIPAVAKPCMEARGLTEQEILPNKEIAVLNDQLKKQMEEKEGKPENMLEGAQEMNDGNPVAEPQEQEAAPQEEMEQPSPEEMMRYGGMRRLRRAQQGMEQMAPEQGGDQMGQVIQEVQAALERGAEPSDVIMSLLQNGVPPEGIVQIFTQLGASQEQAVGLVQEVMQQGQGGGQEQMPQGQPSMEGEPMSEEEAMMMQQQQMQQQAPPMAMYGMSMGGYDMPFFDVPQAAYGMSMGAGMSQNYQGRPKKIPSSGSMFPLAKAQDGIEVPYDPAWETDPAKRTAALRRAYAQANRKGSGTKIYVLKDGKRVEQKVSAKTHDKYSGTDLTSGWNGNQVAAATFEAMKATFNDEKAKIAFGNQVRKTLAESKSYKGKGGGYSDMYDDMGFKNKDGTPKKAADLTNDEIVEKYLRMQERNLKTTTLGDKIGVKGYGTYLYTDWKGELREMEDVDIDGDGVIKPNSDEEGFKTMAKKANPNLTDAEITTMRTKIKDAGLTSLSAASDQIGLPMKSTKGKANKEYREEAYLQQAGFQAADALMKDMSANPNKYDEDTYTSLLGIASFNGYDAYGKQVGVSDESGMGTVNISPIDAYYTNTTQGEIQGHHDLSFEDIPPDVDPDCQCDDPNKPNYSKFKDADGKCTCTPPKDKPKDCPCKKSDGTEINMTPNADGTCPPCTEDETIETPGPPSEWWLQDTIKTTGAFGDMMGIKKHMPWAPGVDLETPRPVFLDPTRELGANAEQANIQTQGMAQFAGPQALSARSSGIQGQAAKNAADILSKYNNANVNIANQFEMKATDVRNQESMLKQASAQRLYDQNTVANQQFDNAKLAMRNNLRNQYTSAITNRWKTDALNQMYPNYQVSPGVGGRMYYQPTEKNTNPQGSGGMTMQEAMDWCKKNNPNATDHSACMSRVMGQQSKSGGGNSGPNANAVNTMYPSKMGGPVYEDGGYVHINSWLPFIL